MSETVQIACIVAAVSLVLVSLPFFVEWLAIREAERKFKAKHGSQDSEG